jgi:hypothetical protein
MMTKVPGAGRYCETCKGYGEHHSDRHDLIVNGIPLAPTARINGVEYSLVTGKRTDGLPR